jgi:hypothetical protein
MRAARVRSFWRTRWDTAGPGGPPLASICPAGVMAHEATARGRECRNLARVYPRELEGRAKVAPAARTGPARDMRGWKRASPVKGAAMPDETPFDAASLVASAETAAGF